MINPELALKLNEAIGILQSLDKPKILRPELGVESFESFLNPVLEELYQKTSIMLRVAGYIGKAKLQTVLDHLTAINSVLLSLTTLSNTEFVSQKHTAAADITALLDVIRGEWATFYVAFQEHFPPSSSEQQGLLEIARINQELKVKSEEADNDLKNLKSTIEETLKIRDAAQNTAQGVSIQAAQVQFSSAQTNLYIKIGLSALGALIFLSWFFITAYNFLEEANGLENYWSWKIGYHASIRAIILGSIVALSAYCLTILRAYLHLLEHNSHRQRVANSTEAFVAAAVSPEQRDLILGRLVDSVTTFGDSGLLKSSTNEITGAPKVSFDITNKS